MTPADARFTEDWMVAEYGFSRSDVQDWIAHLGFDWPMSVKALDEYGHPIGLLNMSDYRIEQEAEQMPLEQPDLLGKLNALRYIAVFSFIVAPAYRGSRLNYDMFSHLLPDLEASYDFVFIPVLHRLKTHQYWQRWGAREFYRDAECVYYLMPLCHHFEAIIEQSSDMNAAYVRVPIDIRALYGQGRLRVEAMFDGVHYRGSVVNMGVKNTDGSPCYIIGMPQAVRRQVGKTFGDTVQVRLRKQ